jgi:O-antigen chain-terminating methyltransferase
MEDAGLQELKDKLDEEETIYAELLAALDSLSDNPAPYERDVELPQLLARLNETWQSEPGPARGTGGVARRLTRKLIEPEIAPLREALTLQQTFNSYLVQFLNRYVETAHDRARGMSELSSTLVRFAQRIDQLADAKDKLYAKLGNTRTDLLLEAMDKRLETISLGLTRTHDRLEGMASSLELARTELASLQHAAETPHHPEGKTSSTPATEPPAPLNAFEYLAFESRFRGSSDDIREKLSSYIRYFEGVSPVLDLGCGRGEFLELLRDAGIEARGVDSNTEMLAVCRERGLDVAEGDLFAFLRELAEESQGGIFAAQVIEHLPPTHLREMLASCHRALRKGGRLVLETVNPKSLTALLAFYQDLTHQKPLLPEALDFLLRACGFREVDFAYSSAVPERSKLLSITADDDTAQTLNENFRKLNAVLFGDLDYAAIATK